jgi:hypothetical protein
MQESVSLWKWTRLYVLCTPLTLVCVYVLFHLFWNVPFSSLISPSVVICGVTVMQALLMYLARRYSDSHQHDTGIHGCDCGVFDGSYPHRSALRREIQSA